MKPRKVADLNSYRELIVKETFFISHPLTLFARPTQTDTDLLPQRHGGMEAKTVNRFAIILKLMPERHLKLLPGHSLSRRSSAKTGRPGKKSLLSAYVCVGLWLIKLGTSNLFKYLLMK